MSTPSVDSTLGALELGTLFGTFLFGLVTVQCSSYFRDYPKDGLLLKSAVATMWFLELGHTVLTWHMVYSLSVTYYGQPEHIAEPPATFALTVLLGQTICFIVQIFFANRIQLFSKSWLIPVICWVLTLAHYSLDITALGILLKFGELSILRDRFDWIVAGALGLGTAVDVLMTVTLCYRLWRIRDSSFHRTRRVADTLITWAIESTFVKSGAGVFELSLFLTRDDLWWTVFYLMQASLFSNSMLVALNGRQRIAALSDTTFVEFAPSNGQRGLDSHLSGRNRNMVIQMSRVTETDNGHVIDPTRSDTKAECD